MSLRLIKDEGLSEDKSFIFNGLNPAQKEAVATINGPLLIIAGAGSGKTKVLTHRVANFLEQGIKPWNILALTFTNKAASEMKDRIAKLVSPDAAQKIWAGTFHSIFARILRIEAELIGYNSNYSIYDQDDSLSLVKKAMQALMISPQNLPPQQVRSKISKAKNNLVTLSDFKTKAKFPNDKMVGQIFEEYEKMLKANNAMDFDDLLIKVIELFNLHPQILQKYHERFHYIMVDEYQDTNRAQYIAIQQLAKARCNICVVGDDAQSIYAWRGADIRNILDFKDDYQNVKVVKLEQNYRSTKKILAAADSVIRYNRDQLKKTLWTDNPDGESINLVVAPDERSEADKIIKTISAKMKNGDSLKEIAVLYRTNAQSLELENAARKYKIPYTIVGGMSFYKRKEVKDVMSYLKLLINPNDSESLLRIVNEPPRGLGQTSLNRITEFSRRMNMPLLKAFETAEMIGDLQRRAMIASKTFAAMVNKFSEFVGKIPLVELVSDYINATGLIQMHQEIGSEESKERARNIEQLINDVAYAAKANPELELSDYIQQISLVSEIDDKDLNAERLTLMTMHSAKGLEFDEVFIAGMEQGLFPLTKSESDDKEIEEERRLFYVGITRAKKRLTLTYGERRMRFGSINFQAPSKFLGEIDKSLYSGVDIDDIPVQRAPKPIFKQAQQKQESYFNDIPQNESYSQIPEQSFNFKVGDTVRHVSFGTGRVTGLAGVGAQRKITVAFAAAGKKQLMLQYAKLELIK